MIIMMSLYRGYLFSFSLLISTDKITEYDNKMYFSSIIMSLSLSSKAVLMRNVLVSTVFPD